MQPLMHPSRLPPPAADALASLPLLTLYLTERCNSRCVSCDHWRTGRADLTPAAIEAWLPSLAGLGTRVVQFSGGEPLLHPQWPAIAQRLRAEGLQLWLLTAGLALAKQAEQVHACFDAVTVSLDGTTPANYAAIRGLDAFDAVCAGVRRLAQLGTPPGLRVTVQRANHADLPAFVALAHGLGARSVSFLAADVGNPQAFGREPGGDFGVGVALRAEDLPRLREGIATLEREHAADFRSGFIAESPDKLRRIVAHGAALLGLDAPPAVRCNAPEFSAVIEADGSLRPCFFIPGPGVAAGTDLRLALNGGAMRQLRRDIREQRRAECRHCVCSMWREPQALAAAWGART